VEGTGTAGEELKDGLGESIKSGTSREKLLVRSFLSRGKICIFQAVINEYVYSPTFGSRQI